LVKSVVALCFGLVFVFGGESATLSALSVVFLNTQADECVEEKRK
jgi:hypothetical protein